MAFTAISPVGKLNFGSAVNESASTSPFTARVTTRLATASPVEKLNFSSLDKENFDKDSASSSPNKARLRPSHQAILHPNKKAREALSDARNPLLSPQAGLSRTVSVLEFDSDDIPTRATLKLDELLGDDFEGLLERAEVGTGVAENSDNDDLLSRRVTMSPQPSDDDDFGFLKRRAESPSSPSERYRSSTPSAADEPEVDWGMANGASGLSGSFKNVSIVGDRVIKRPKARDLNEERLAKQRPSQWIAKIRRQNQEELVETKAVREALDMAKDKIQVLKVTDLELSDDGLSIIQEKALPMEMPSKMVLAQLFIDMGTMWSETGLLLGGDFKDDNIMQNAKDGSIEVIDWRLQDDAHDTGTDLGLDVKQRLEEHLFDKKDDRTILNYIYSNLIESLDTLSKPENNVKMDRWKDKFPGLKNENFIPELREFLSNQIVK